MWCVGWLETRTADDRWVERYFRLDGDSMNGSMRKASRMLKPYLPPLQHGATQASSRAVRVETAVPGRANEFGFSVTTHGAAHATHFRSISAADRARWIAAFRAVGVPVTDETSPSTSGGGAGGAGGAAGSEARAVAPRARSHARGNSALDDCLGDRIAANPPPFAAPRRSVTEPMPPRAVARRSQAHSAPRHTEPRAPPTAPLPPPPGAGQRAARSGTNGSAHRRAKTLLQVRLAVEQGERTSVERATDAAARAREAAAALVAHTPAWIDAAPSTVLRGGGAVGADSVSTSGSEELGPPPSFDADRRSVTHSSLERVGGAREDDEGVAGAAFAGGRAERLSRAVAPLGDDDGNERLAMSSSDDAGETDEEEGDGDVEEGDEEDEEGAAAKVEAFFAEELAKERRMSQAERRLSIAKLKAEPLEPPPASKSSRRRRRRNPALASKRKEERATVRVLLCTVTFYANHAHNLTRSP